MRTQQKKHTRLQGRKSYVSAAKGAAEGQKKKTNLQTNLWSPPIRRRVKPMKKHNKENEEKDSDTHGQETEEVTGREKVGKGAIRKRRHNRK